MKGLLRKDILMMKDNYRGFALFLLLYVVLGVMAENTGMLTGILVIIMMMLPISSMQVDEYYRWDQYVLTMPVSRKMVVHSKYLFCLFIMAVIFLVAILFETLIDGNLADAFYNALVMVSLATGINAVGIPCIFKWGTMKGRMIVLMMCGFAGAIMAILGLTVIVPQHMEPMPPMPGERAVEPAISGDVLMAVLNSAALPVILFVIAMLALLISCRISCRIYEKREL